MDDSKGSLPERSTTLPERRMTLPADCWIYAFDFIAPIRTLAFSCVSSKFRLVCESSLKRPRRMLLPRGGGDNGGNEFALKALSTYTDATEYVYRHHPDIEQLIRAGIDCHYNEVILRSQTLALMILDSSAKFRHLEAVHLLVDATDELELFVVNAPSLRSLKLGHTPLASLSFLRHCAHLTDFSSLARDFAPKGELRHLACVPDLRRLGLSNVSLVGEPLSTLLEFAPRNLVEFGYHCSSLEELELLSSTLPMLEEVHCFYAQHDKDILELFPNLTSFKSTPFLVAEASRDVLGIRDLDLISRHIPVHPATECEEVALCASLERCPHLTSLQVLTRVDVRRLDVLWTLRDLTQLSLRCCALTHGCESLFGEFPRLHRLLLAHCVFEEGWAWAELGTGLSRTAVRDLELRCFKAEHQVRYDDIVALLSRVRLGRLTVAVLDETAALLNGGNFEESGNPKILDVVTLPTQSPHAGTPSLDNI